MSESISIRVLLVEDDDDVRSSTEQALSLAEYLGEPRRVTPDLLDAACASYFVDEQETPPVYA